MDLEALPPISGEPVGTIRTTDVLGALSAASDLALGMPEGHAARSCYLGMAEEVARTLWAVFEQWDGKGPNRARGDSIPLASRIVAVTSLVEAFHAVGGRTAAIRVAEARNGTVFDPVLVEAFLQVAGDQA